jgi:hypothetical protein
MFLPSLFLAAALFALPPDVDPALFPGLATHSDADLQLAGLSVLYPGRVLSAPPLTPNPGDAGRAPLSLELPHQLPYLRVYDLAAAQPKLAALLAAHPALILDLRYVVANVPAAEAFAGTLARAGLPAAPLHALGDFPAPAPLPAASAKTAPPLILALVNRQTAGPLEAWLAVFQTGQDLLTVGSPTAGQPSLYHPTSSTPPLYIITGELQPASGSIIGAGLAPRFPVEVTPEQNYRAYAELERGLDLTALLRSNRPVAPSPATNTPGPPPTPKEDDATDPVLQRAVDVVAALQLLGRVPSLPTPSSTPVPSTSSPVTQPAQPGP